MHAWILCHLRGQSTSHDDATTIFAQQEWREMVKRATKPSTPEDDIGTQHRAIWPSYPICQNLAEHWPALQDAAFSHRFDRWRNRQAGDGNNRRGRQATSYAVFDQRDGGATVLLSKWAGAEFRRSARDPGRGRHARDLVEQLDGRDAAADHDHMLAGELFGRAVVLGVQLPAFKALRARILRDVRRLPGAGGVDDTTSREVAAIGFDP